MTARIKHNIAKIIICGMFMTLLFGCASVKEIKISQKYENSKSWLKDKWQTMGDKFSSSDDDATALQPYSKDSNYLVYRTQWPYETLPGIAEWFTGDSENWKKLAAANPKLKPKHIPANQPVLIPAKLVKKKTRPTETFAARYRVYYYAHQVRWSGESLSLIAKWYTGHYGNWKKLAQANPGLNPNRIVLGNLIYIPPELMKTKKPLPRKEVAKTLPGYFAHTVTQSDEKLSEIAEWYTGDAGNDKAIAEANADIDPELLLIGNEIFIPSVLLITQKPLDRKPTQKTTATAPGNQSKTEEAAPAPKSKKIQLFGPKQFQAN
ncbi:MAG: LysM peptidoglycan-binding domain-containing protein [Desulfobacterales bacterium]|nr:LysM peptidoglycan-binding domain-containing protein [Desulfobacterales bacterium]